MQIFLALITFVCRFIDFTFHTLYGYMGKNMDIWKKDAEKSRVWYTEHTLKVAIS